MTNNATDAPPRPAARRYSEHLHILVDETTRAYILGAAVLAAASGGYARPKEAEAARDLLDEAIAQRYAENAKEYRKAVAAGRREMSRRAAAGDIAA